MRKSRIIGTKPAEYNGIKYRSTLEADTAWIFDLLGIEYSYESKSFELLGKFKYKGKGIQAIKYVPDFILLNNIFIECKGWETPEWKLKKKLFYNYLVINNIECDFYIIKKSNLYTDIKTLIVEKFPELLDKYEQINQDYKLASGRASVSRRRMSLILTDKEVCKGGI